MRAATVTNGDEIMTDYQFRAIVKMILDIVKKSENVDEIQKSLEDLLESADNKDN